MWQTILYGPIYLLILKIILFIFGCAKSLLLLGLFSVCGKQGLLSSCGARASHRSGFSCCRAWAQGGWASVVAAPGLSSCCSWAPGHRLTSCGTWVQLLCGMWGLPGSGIEPASLALAGRFFTTEHQGSPSPFILNEIAIHLIQSGDFCYIAFLALIKYDLTCPLALQAQVVLGMKTYQIHCCEDISDYVYIYK